MATSDARVVMRVPAARHADYKRWANEAGLRTGRGDGVSELLRECMLRYGAKTAAELAHEGPSRAAEASSVPQEVRGSASPRRGEEGVEVHRERAPFSSAVDTARWVAGRTGMPAATVKRELERGGVRVDGEPLADLEPPGRLMDAVARGVLTLRGKPV